ncbi:hypothetical protein [Gudongella sp. SC589]|uniref:hypothetical protein n=1 Tax=Gudongella sp. SC589 TaxID=3385990 RepID=UPI0039049253
MRIEFHTDTVKKSNEDIYGLTKRGAFVIDGASALTDRSFVPDGNDVSWMVQWWRDYLDGHLDDTSYSIKEILKEGVRKFNKEYGRYVDLDSLEAHEQLSAGIAILRKNGDILESFVLGDVEISVKSRKGECSIVTDQALKGLDAEVIDLMRRNHQREKQVIFKGFTEQELEILIRNRKKMNVPGGYYILGHSVDAIDMGIYRTFQADEIEKCLLSTDGIVPLNYKYTRSNLLERIRQSGVRDVIRELRGMEESDREKRSIGRLKTHDDATLIYLDFSLQS